MRAVRSARRWFWLAGIGLALAAWWWASAPLAAPLPVAAGSGNVPTVVEPEVADPALERVMAPEMESAPAPTERANELARGGTVRVVDALGVVVEGAEVQWSRGGENEPFARGTTGADGTCRFAGRERELWVRAHDPAIGTSVQVQAWIGDPVLVLPLLRPVWVRGRVELRDPAVGRLVVLVEGELLVQRTEVGVVAPVQPIEVGDDGTFGFEAAAGATLKLWARDDREWRVPEQKEVVVDGLEVVLAAPDRYAVHGVVLDEHGAPVVGKDVPAFGGWSSGGPIPFVLVGDQSFAVRADGSFVATTTKSPTRAHAWMGNRTSPAVDITFAPGQSRRDVVLQLSAMVATGGRAVGVDGSPAAGRPVQAEGEGRGERVIYRAEAGADGRFAFELPIGSRWRLSSEGGESVEVAAGQQDVVLVWREPQPSRATGVRLEIVGGNGRDAAFPWCEWWRLQDDMIVRELVQLRAADGEQWLDEPRHAPWTLVVHDGPAAVHHTFVAGAVPSELRLELQPPASLEVSVQRAGKPLRGLDVLVEPCGPSERAVGDERGVFRLSYVTPGPAFVRVRRGAEVLASRAVELVPGQRTALTIEVP
jgi:hypothetical protein